MYIQEKDGEQKAPPDYSGHTYRPPTEEPYEPPSVAAEPPSEPTKSAAEEPREPATEPAEPSAPVGLFEREKPRAHTQKDGKRGGISEHSGLGGLFSRVPFLSSLLPPSRERCEGKREHGDWWDLAILGLAVLFLLDGNQDNDVLPILLLLLLWD